MATTGTYNVLTHMTDSAWLEDRVKMYVLPHGLERRRETKQSTQVYHYLLYITLHIKLPLCAVKSKIIIIII